MSNVFAFLPLEFLFFVELYLKKSEERLMQMAYVSRCESKTEIYHVMIRGINHEKIFKNDMDKHVVKGLIYKKMTNRDVTIYAYCIMDTHLHLLIKAPIWVLSKFMSCMENAYARYYNNSRHRNGHVFQNRFKSECVESEDYFYCCMRYIHNNPVKAGLCIKKEEYPFSSLYEIEQKRYFLIKDIEIIENSNHYLVKDLMHVFIDTPDDKMNQFYEILEMLIHFIIDEYQLESKYEILEHEIFFSKLLHKFAAITHMTIRNAGIFIFDSLRESSCA